MSLELCVLASGSAGNCSVLRAPGGVVLIDAGVGPRATAKRLCGTGVSIGDISAVVLTHLDSDHFKREWASTLVKRGIRVFCHATRRRELTGGDETEFAGVVRTFYDGRPFEPVAGVSFEPIPLAHDADGSHGFLIECAGSRIGFATDLGKVPELVLKRFCGLDLLAIECNYDPGMQRSSGRPWFLQQRITGGRGHLSNEQCFRFLQALFDRCECERHRLPRHVVLLHRSRQCNCPKIVRALFAGDSRFVDRLILSEQYERTDWLTVENDRRLLVGEQISMRWG